jgi:hypothetical protein
MIAPLEEDYSLDPTLTAQQHRVITLLAAGNSITEAAEAEGLHRNTVGYWRRTSPAFCRELELALREQRLYWHEQATRLAPQALAVIQDTLTNPDTSPSLRFRAATLILKMATDPNAKAIARFSTLNPELEAVSGQVHALRKELLVRSPQIANAAQNCTNAQPIRKAPEPGRNSLCPCNSGLKYKRCCADRSRTNQPRFDSAAPPIHSAETAENIAGPDEKYAQLKTKLAIWEANNTQLNDPALDPAA